MTMHLHVLLRVHGRGHVLCMAPVLTGTAIVVLIAICCLSPQNSGWEGHAQVANDVKESTMEDMISGQEVCLHVCIGVVVTSHSHTYIYIYIIIQSCTIACIISYRDKGKSKQRHLKTTLFFPREKEELPWAGLEPATFCVLDRHCTS